MSRRYLPPMCVRRHRWLSGQLPWEMRTSHIQQCIKLLETQLAEEKARCAEYMFDFMILYLIRANIRPRLMWICRFKRELVLRKEYPQYRAFTNYFFLNRDDATSRLVCADYLEEIGKPVLARKMRLAANGQLA